MVSTAAFHASGLGSRSRRFERNKMFLPHPRVKLSIVGSLCDQEVACSASDSQGSNFESRVWRTVSSHHPQEVLLAQFSLNVHKGGLKADSFHFQRAQNHEVFNPKVGLIFGKQCNQWHQHKVGSQTRFSIDVGG